MSERLMSDADFELLINNWPPESAAQLRAMPYPHDWDFVVSSMAEWWVQLSPETNEMLARVFPPKPRYRVEVINIAGSGKNDVYVYAAEENETVEDVKRHAFAWYTAQNCMPEGVEAELITDSNQSVCAHFDIPDDRPCEYCSARADCFFHVRHPAKGNS